MTESLFFQVALIGLRLRKRHGIPRDDDFIPNACCFCEIQLEYEDIHFVHNAAEEEPVHYEVCPECYHKAPLMEYNRDQFE